MTFSRNRAGLSATQLSALVKLRQGALPWINRAFGRKRASPSTWISYITASALVREGLATISVSGCGSWLRLTASGRLHAQALAEPAEAESSHQLEARRMWTGCGVHHGCWIKKDARGARLNSVPPPSRHVRLCFLRAARPCFSRHFGPGPRM
jgi:hypothetical protein